MEPGLEAASSTPKDTGRWALSHQGPWCFSMVAFMSHGGVESRASISLLVEWKQKSTRVVISAMPTEPCILFFFF